LGCGPGNSTEILFRRWIDFSSSCESQIIYHSADFYYGILSLLGQSINIWETIYYHVLESHQALIEWYRCTGMKTYLEQLPDDASRIEFEKEVSEEASAFYPLQANNKVINPFRRLFFIAQKGS
jgi:trans-aconitate 2-methyltransferase